MPGPEPPPVPRVRLDKWLWAARFFKTRSLAAQAVDGGKIDVNGDPAKRARPVQAGDRIPVRRPPFAIDVVVRGTAELRGPAREAMLLYQETEESQKAREVLARELKERGGEPFLASKGRPTKRNRREMDRLKRSW
jgi:ribosome-associated heat shock protein Hsp15